MGDEKFDFVIDFYADARELVKGCIWADNQIIEDFDDEDKTRISFSSTQVLKVQEWILSKAENAVPLSPDWLVEEWKNSIIKMMERCRNSV